MTDPLSFRLTEAADRLQSGLVTTAGPIRALLRDAADRIDELEANLADACDEATSFYKRLEELGEVP